MGKTVSGVTADAFNARIFIARFVPSDKAYTSLGGVFEHTLIIKIKIFGFKQPLHAQPRINKFKICTVKLEGDQEVLLEIQFVLST